MSLSCMPRSPHVDLFHVQSGWGRAADSFFDISCSTSRATASYSFQNRRERASAARKAHSARPQLWPGVQVIRLAFTPVAPSRLELVSGHRWIYQILGHVCGYIFFFSVAIILLASTHRYTDARLICWTPGEPKSKHKHLPALSARIATTPTIQPSCLASFLAHFNTNTLCSSQTTRQCLT
jgi:hypothetical protein